MPLDGGAMPASPSSGCEGGGRGRGTHRVIPDTDQPFHPSAHRDSGQQEAFAIPVPGSDNIIQLVTVLTGQRATLTGRARGVRPRAVAYGRSRTEPSTAAPVFSPQQRLRPA